MWRVHPRDVEALRSPGGHQFTDFVDRLILAECRLHNVPYSEVHTNLCTSLRDGGVDAIVDEGLPGDRSGWLGVPTVWQYKAEKRENLTPGKLIEDINKGCSSEYIRHGYGYRLSVSCEIAPAQSKELETRLSRAARALNPDAPAVKLLTASDLAVWAERFPAIVSACFDRGLTRLALHLDAWARRVRATTPIFVPVPDWGPIEKAIVRHVDLSTTAPGQDPVVCIQGGAGIGKTRLVCEILSRLQGLRALVLYTDDDEHLKKLAMQLTNDDSASAIIVADECSLQTRLYLQTYLQSCTERVRVIAIDNSGERFPGGREVRMERPSVEAVEMILERNFPHVPPAERARYARLTEGFVRLAADMCVAGGNVPPTGYYVSPFEVGRVEPYYCVRLSNEERAVVEAIALVSKVGYSDQVRSEFQELCSLVALSCQPALHTACNLVDLPGFVARTSRFLYVTPDIIAKVAFDRAWRSWVEPDPDAFLTRLPSRLVEPFLKRVGQWGTDAVREKVTVFFQQWMRGLKCGDLMDECTCNRVVLLAEAHPELYLPALSTVIESANPENLPGFRAKQELVWLAEKLAAFSNYFDFAEVLLLRLTVTESEPNAADSATCIWRRLFSISGSGTEVPFELRLHKLQQRIASGDKHVALQGIAALGELLEDRAPCPPVPIIVAGRMLPAEWSPKDVHELRACVRGALKFICRLLGDERLWIREAAGQVLVSKLTRLLARGHLDDVKTLFRPGVICDSVRVQMAGQIQSFLGQYSDNKGLPTAYMQDVEAWLGALTRDDLRERLQLLLAGPQWHDSSGQAEDAWKGKLAGLARDLMHDPSVFADQMEWLCSPEATDAGALGYEMGQQDDAGELLELLVDSALRFRSTSLAGGYVCALIRCLPGQVAHVNEVIDGAQERDAETAYGLYVAGGEVLNALGRTLRLVNCGALPAGRLYPLLQGAGFGSLQCEDVWNIVDCLTHALQRSDTTARPVLLYLVARSLKTNMALAQGQLEQVWTVLADTANMLVLEVVYWEELLNALVSVDPSRVAAIALEATTKPNQCALVAFRLLAKMATDHPGVVLGALGATLLDPERSKKFCFGSYRPLVEGLPSHLGISWVERHGLLAAQRLARFLPVPYVNDAGQPIVPPLTAFVLGHFEEDEDVFTSFCCGVHSFQPYTGDIAQQYENEAATAQAFLKHPLRRLREWASIERQSALEEARSWRQRCEEDSLKNRGL